MRRVAGFVKPGSSPRYRPLCQVQQTVDAPRSWFSAGGGPASFHFDSQKGSQYSITWDPLSQHPASPGFKRLPVLRHGFVARVAMRQIFVETMNIMS